MGLNLFSFLVYFHHLETLSPITTLECLFSYFGTHHPFLVHSVALTLSLYRNCSRDETSTIFKLLQSQNPMVIIKVSKELLLL